ncbi:MAG: hypothetical protein HC779_08195 [Phyllobacteriaceae bacterium]|nr:hypothetical protein [Phyllobacteriaceae bacterium]
MIGEVARYDDVLFGLAHQHPIMPHKAHGGVVGFRAGRAIKTLVHMGGRNFGHLAYEVDDIYETCDRLMKAGVTINRPPRDGSIAFIRRACA